MRDTKKGITLIALIITIIVMLILVGVTINISMNGGLFNKSREGRESTQLESDREELLSVVLGAYDEVEGIVNGETLQSTIGEGWQIEGNGPYAVTSPKGIVYTVAKNGTISEGWVNNGDGTYTKGTETVTVGVTTYTNAQVQEKLGASGGTYTGTWTVIGVEGGKVKLVSTENVGTCRLGYKDEVANSAKTVEQYNEMTDNEKMERGIASYQRAMTTIGEKVTTSTGISSARSINLQDIYDIIGEENVDKTTNNSNYGKTYNYYYNTTDGYVYSKESTDGGTTWSSLKKTSYTSETFVNANGEKIVVDSEGDEVTLTYDFFSYTLTADQKTAIGSLATGYYWLTSQCVDCNNIHANLDVRNMNSGNLYASNLFGSYGYGRNISIRSPRRSFHLKSRWRNINKKE